MANSSSNPDEANPPSPAPTEYFTPASTFDDPPSPTPSEQLQDEFNMSTLFPTGTNTPEETGENLEMTASAESEDGGSDTTEQASEA
jgi:hypothetical protein